MHLFANLRKWPGSMLLAACSTLAFADTTTDGHDRATFQAALPAYSVALHLGSELGPVPVLDVYRNGLRMLRLPLVSALDSSDAHEHLSDVHYQLGPPQRPEAGERYALTVQASSSLWQQRVFHWRLYDDHLEFDQSASGHGQIGRSHVFSNGVPGRWDKGRSEGGAWNASLMADRYWSPSPNHANLFDHNIAEPQTLGFGGDAHSGSEEDFRPAQMGDLFSPPPLMLAFHVSGEWASVGIGTPPGQYRFPALEYSGSRYAGAAWWVDYLGYARMEDQPGGHFQSPVAAIHFGYSALDTLEHYTQWMRSRGFGTEASYPDVAWHHLPIFCGWAEQTSTATPYGRPPNAESTQSNYEAWLAELDRRKLPVGTVVIDDKWQKGYGNFEIDTAKWPDLKGFVARQHAVGRHVLLWVPVAHSDGLPDSLCVTGPDGKCLAPKLGDPAYEAFLRGRIRELVEKIGIDGFKEDWVWAPTQPGLPVPPALAGMEAVRHFQQMLYSEAHRWRPDALVETQTSNLAFRDSSDVLRLNDVWYATRDIVAIMRERADIAHISGWPLVDTDNASSTTLDTWRSYMAAQPSIGIPALYFVHRTESTLERPDQGDWQTLSSIWQRYIEALGKATNPGTAVHAP
ncbi:MAG: hypothetical protein JO006_13600 [Paucibacter sp.]|nr:hypothetical protein [Roseateles sp.]